MRPVIARLMSVVFAICFVSGSWAVSKDSSLASVRGSTQQINISAEKGSARRTPAGYESVFRGSVKVQQGNVTLTCDRLVVEYEDKKNRNGKQPSKNDPVGNIPADTDIKSIVAAGNVKIVQGERMAFAGKAVYDNSARTITLSEEPRLWQGGNTVRTQTIIMYLDEDRYETGPGGVEMVISPGKNQREKDK